MFIYKVKANGEEFMETTDFQEAIFYRDVCNEIYGKENVSFEMVDYYAVERR